MGVMEDEVLGKRNCKQTITITKNPLHEFNIYNNLRIMSCDTNMLK